MNANPVTVSQARRDMRWSVSQSDEAAEAAARRHREIARIIDRAERERREEARHMRIFRTATEFFGQTRAVEITYEPDRANPPSVVIHAITLVRQICKRGEYWYDQNGNFHAGPHFERTEVSGQLDREQLQALGEEVIGQSMTYRRRGG